MLLKVGKGRTVISYKSQTVHGLGEFFKYYTQHIL
jgi:hypothetical protein